MIGVYKMWTENNVGRNKCGVCEDVFVVFVWKYRQKCRNPLVKLVVHPSNLKLSTSPMVGAEGWGVGVSVLGDVSQYSA
jgi:hypothetical protein